MSEIDKSTLQDLILVAGHAAFKEGIENVPEHPERDEGWALQDFQSGEPPFYIEHIRRGVVLAAHNPRSLLIFSGGRTRKQSGRWSEAATYLEIARHHNWWISKIEKLRKSVSDRTITEEYARDSFENLLFGICRFHQHAGHYPLNVTVVSWGFKRARFDLHRATIRFPEARYRFEGFNAPVDIRAAWRGEAKALHDFIEDPYGLVGGLAEKRNRRNPFNQRHPYAEEFPELSAFFSERPQGFVARLPWESPGSDGSE